MYSFMGLARGLDEQSRVRLACAGYTQTEIATLDDALRMWGNDEWWFQNRRAELGVVEKFGDRDIVCVASEVERGVSVWLPIRELN
jgi:hypothetical protein